MSSDSRSALSVDEDARRRFETAWRAGRPEPIEHFLPAEQDPRFLATLEELLLIELEFAWKAWATVGSVGDATAPLPQRRPPGVETYLARFPSVNRPDFLHRLLEEEYRLRQRWGDNPSTNEYRQRVPSLDLTPETSLSPTAAPSRKPPTIPGYEILSELGHGGMGVVYKARHLGLNRLVALKMIRTGAHATVEELARFGAEAEAVAALQHPNIV